MSGKRPKTRPKTDPADPDARSPYLKGGEFRRNADEANEPDAPVPSLSEVDWADLPPKLKEKRQRG
jgi:hypothetical protein